MGIWKYWCGRAGGHSQTILVLLWGAALMGVPAALWESEGVGIVPPVPSAHTLSRFKFRHLSLTGASSLG